MSDDRLETPAAMRAQLTPEMRDILAAQKSRAPVSPADPEKDTVRARFEYAALHSYWNEIVPGECHAEDLEIPTADGVLSAVRIRPRASSEMSGRLLYLHGGGWVFGSTVTHRAAMMRLALSCNVEVVGIEYRLAPEWPFPAALQDTLAAWKWMRPDPGSQGAFLYVAGDSAGAHLALDMMLELRRFGAPLPDAALLFYGAYLAHESTQSNLLYGDGQYGLSSERMAWFRRCYFEMGQGAAVAGRTPVESNLEGLPPLLITAAQCDCLHDDSIALEHRARQCGVVTELKVYQGVVHGFMQMARSLPAAVEAFEDAASFLRRNRWR